MLHKSNSRLEEATLGAPLNDQLWKNDDDDDHISNLEPISR